MHIHSEKEQPTRFEHPNELLFMPPELFRLRALIVQLPLQSAPAAAVLRPLPPSCMGKSIWKFAHRGKILVQESFALTASLTALPSALFPASLAIAAFIR